MIDISQNTILYTYAYICACIVLFLKLLFFCYCVNRRLNEDLLIINQLESLSQQEDKVVVDSSKILEMFVTPPAQVWFLGLPLYERICIVLSAIFVSYLIQKFYQDTFIVYVFGEVIDCCKCIFGHEET